jgi:hypothetical protein
MFVNNSVLFFIFFFYGVTQVHDQGHEFDILTCVDLSYFFFRFHLIALSWIRIEFCNLFF